MLKPYLVTALAHFVVAADNQNDAEEIASDYLHGCEDDYLSIDLNSDQVLLRDSIDLIPPDWRDGYPLTYNGCSAELTVAEMLSEEPNNNTIPKIVNINGRDYKLVE